MCDYKIRFNTRAGVYRDFIASLIFYLLFSKCSCFLYILSIYLLNDVLTQCILMIFSTCGGDIREDINLQTPENVLRAKPDPSRIQEYPGSLCGTDNILRRHRNDHSIEATGT